MKLLGSKKGQIFDNVSGILVGLASVMIVGVVAFLIMSQVSTNSLVTADSNATNAVTQAQSAGNTTMNFLPLVAIAAIGAVLIGLVALFRNRPQ